MFERFFGIKENPQKKGPAEVERKGAGGGKPFRVTKEEEYFALKAREKTQREEETQEAQEKRRKEEAEAVKTRVASHFQEKERKETLKRTGEFLGKHTTLEQHKAAAKEGQQREEQENVQL